MVRFFFSFIFIFSSQSSWGVFIGSGVKQIRNSGTGITISPYITDDEKTNGLVAIKVPEESPAQLAGLKTGDLISSVNGVSVRGKSLKEIEEAIMGPEDPQVTLTIRSLCDNKKRVVSINTTITTPLNNWKNDSHFINLRQEEGLDCEDSVDDGGPQALYVPLKSFMNNTNDPIHLCNDFLMLQKRDMDNSRSVGMILDLRGNRGGNLVTVSCMLNSIIEDNDIIVQQIPVQNSTHPSGDKLLTYYFTAKGPISSTRTDFFLSYNKPIVVLVNKGSGSASEIFAGTIQDKKRGWVVGDRTRGKGGTQDVLPFSPSGMGANSLLSGTTTAIYTLNSGRSPQHSGIIPDFRFSIKGESIEMEDPSQYVSPEGRAHSIKFENNQWEQNRPEEVAGLKTCINKDDKMGVGLKQKIQNDERYRRPFVGDYQLELAKDILMCSPVVPLSYKIHSEGYDIYISPFLERSLEAHR